MAITSELQLAGGVAATLVQPQSPGPVPAVLLLHGFASNREEVGGLFARLATQMAARGITSLRLDFRGFGQSRLPSERSSLHTMMEDAQLGLRRLGQADMVDEGRIAVLGYSLGGVIAAELASKTPEVAALGLWATPRTFGISSLLSPAHHKVLDGGGTVELDLGWRTLRVGRPLVDYAEDFDVTLALPGFGGFVFGAVGGVDGIAADHAAYEALRAPDTKSRFLVLPGANHVFGEVGPGPQHGEALLAATTAAFADFFHLA